MKKSHRNIWSIIGVTMLLVLSVGIVACTRGSSSGSATSNEEKAIRYYTCSMHPQIHADHPGTCPICGMNLVPVYAEEVPASAASSSAPSVVIPWDRQQLIGVQTVPIEKKSVEKELRTVGRVAFDPDLAVAQQEFLAIVASAPTLKSAAVSRLKLLGMSAEEIRALEKRRKPSTNLYLPAAGDAVWIYATLYPGEPELVKIGAKADITLPTGGTRSFTGTVRAVDPVIDPQTRSARARIEVAMAGGVLRPDTYVNVVIKIALGESLVAPKSAVIDTGMRKVIFIAQEGGQFQPRDIHTGATVGEAIVIVSGAHEGERVVSNATFLVDAESQLKAAAAGGGMPSCPEGQAWDVGMSMCMPKAGH